MKKKTKTTHIWEIHLHLGQKTVRNVSLMDEQIEGLVLMGAISLLASMVSFNPWCFPGSFSIASESSPLQFVQSVIPTHLSYFHLSLISVKIMYITDKYLIRRQNEKKSRVIYFIHICLEYLSAFFLFTKGPHRNHGNQL